MDNIDRYLTLLDHFVQQILEAGGSVSENFTTPSDFLSELIQLRRDLLSATDISRGNACLTLGFLRDWSQSDRIAGFVVALEAEERLERASLRRACEPYSRGQPLFQAAPEAWNLVRIHEGRESELISGSNLSWDNSGQLALFRGGIKVRLGLWIRPPLVSFLQTEVNSKDWFVRLHPYEVGADLLPRQEEAILRPIDPDWWKTLDLRPGSPAAAIYALLGDEPIGSPQYWEYYARGLRRLEVHVRRDTSGLVHGSMEELRVFPHANYLLGLFLHFTAREPVGTNWADAMAEHIDGALNVYLDNAVRQRLAMRLADGKVTDASFRTHLFRVDHVRLHHLLPIAALFFRSTCLLDDWRKDQFRDSLPNPRIQS